VLTARQGGGALFEGVLGIAPHARGNPVVVGGGAARLLELAQRSGVDLAFFNLSMFHFGLECECRTQRRRRALGAVQPHGGLAIRALGGDLARADA